MPWPAAAAYCMVMHLQAPVLHNHFTEQFKSLSQVTPQAQIHVTQILVQRLAWAVALLVAEEFQKGSFMPKSFLNMFTVTLYELY